MPKNLFVRIPPPLHDGLVSYCADATVSSGRRVSMNAVVAMVLAEFLAEPRPLKAVTQP